MSTLTFVILAVVIGIGAFTIGVAVALVFAARSLGHAIQEAVGRGLGW